MTLVAMSLPCPTAMETEQNFIFLFVRAHALANRLTLGRRRTLSALMYCGRTIGTT